MNIKNIFYYAILVALFLSAIIAANGDDKIKIINTKEVGQIEVGGPFVGIEIHKSFPMINRISFYYPVANSIDISENYWKREQYRIMSMGLKVGNNPKLILKEGAWKVSQTPYDVEFTKDLHSSGVSIKYEFCKNLPAMSAEFNIENKSDSVKTYEVYLKYESILKTSHTYAKLDSGETSIDGNGKLITINYNEAQAGNSQVFFYNVDEEPSYCTTKFIKGNYSNPDEYWLNSIDPFAQNGKDSKPVVAFVYKKELQPSESIKITNLIGSLKIGESQSVFNKLSKDYKKEIIDYKNYVLNNSINKEIIKTGNDKIDFTTDWALAVIATNAHYIDSTIAPMPAQAEYNFYFTHDALLTDLAAVNFDLKRVKNDLAFIIKHADKNNVIPHAYYWKDGEYKTEYAGTENWNHFWFTLICSRYLKHSGDLEFAKTLYPYVQQSINTAMKNKENNLMYSFRPDWLDIGSNYGPRAYMTILAIKALREYSYFAAELNIDANEIKKYQDISDSLNLNLTNKLWNKELNYLTSFFEDGTEDKHIYMGSMLASHFGLLDDEKNYKLMETAKKYLLDEKLGVYTLYPMDLHKLANYMGFVEGEAGEPYYYANGGIWPHGNSWYALGLISNKKHEEAYNFMMTTMTMDGVINSPNGQPAMYEYRISDKNNLENYGKIDKPQFLWAGGWYIYSLYNLFGIKENDWNISLKPFLPNDIDSVNLTIMIKGKLIPISINGKGKYISSIMYDTKVVPSYIFNDDNTDFTKISVELGELKMPMILKAETKIINPRYLSEGKTLKFTTDSFSDKEVEIEIISPFSVNKVLNNKVEIELLKQNKLEDGNYKLHLRYTQNSNGNKIELSFN
jgi:cellobiose phosphorylase